MPNTQSTYRNFCKTAPEDFPVFMQDWYLDLVCEEGRWDAVLIENGNEVKAVLPYFLKKKFGKQYVVMPRLCRQMGPYIVPHLRVNKNTFALTSRLIEGLPKLASFEQDFNYSCQNWLPFYWKGYQQTTRYSFRLQLNDLGNIWQGLWPDYRNQKIRKAEDLVRIEHDVSLEEFYRVHNLSFERQGIKPPFSFSFFEKLYKGLMEHESCRIFAAVDKETNEVHAVALLIWDQHTSWFLLAGDDPNLRNSGAGILVAWETIRFTAEELGLEWFDFAGSMIEPIARVRKQFGAEVYPYLRVWKDQHWLWRLKKMW